MSIADDFRLLLPKTWVDGASLTMTDVFPGDGDYADSEWGELTLGTVPTQVVCRECAHHFLTKIRGNATRCPECGAARWMPKRPVPWEGSDDTGSGLSRHPALRRSLVTMTCRRCGRGWETAAAGGCRIRCPGCEHQARVPMRAREEGYVPGPRQTRPEGKRERSRKLGRPLVLAVQDEAEEVEDDGPDYATLRSHALSAVRDLVVSTTARRSVADTVPPSRPALKVVPSRPEPVKVRRSAVVEPQRFRELTPKPASLPFTRPAPAGVQACLHCGQGGTFALAGPGYAQGVLMCRMHAEGEYRTPELRVWAVTSW